MTELYLVRHGQTVWNLEKRLQGSKNSNLTDLGKEQAARLGKRFEDIHIDSAYCSTSDRAMETCRIILGNKTIQPTLLDSIKEMDLKSWEGKLNSEIKAQNEELFNQFWNAPHLMTEFPGETLNDFTNRIINALNIIIKENENKKVLVVTHGLVMRTLINYFKGLPKDNEYDCKIVDPTSLTVVRVEEGNEFQFVLYSDTEHLSDDN